MRCVPAQCSSAKRNAQGFSPQRHEGHKGRLSSCPLSLCGDTGFERAAAILSLPMSSVGKNIPHDSAAGHVSGESVYIDDMAPLRGELIVDFVWSPVAHGRIRGIDFGDAASFAHLFTYRDLHHNLFGAIIQDEFLLAEDVVSFIGHPIVVIAAESRALIRKAKAAIKLDIEELEPVFTIDEAKRRGLFIGKTMTIKRGD